MFLMQRLSVAIQRGNAVCVTDTAPSTSCLHNEVVHRCDCCCFCFMTLFSICILVFFSFDITDKSYLYTWSTMEPIKLQCQLFVTWNKVKYFTASKWDCRCSCNTILNIVIIQNSGTIVLHFSPKTSAVLQTLI